MTWDGKERRSPSEDHDLLTEIHTIMKRLDDAFDEHLRQDKDDFTKVHKRISTLAWIVASGTGIMAAVVAFKEKIFG